MPVTVLDPHDVADRCYLSEALLWAAFSRLPLKFLNDQPDTRDDGSDVGHFAQSPDIEPVTSEECNKVGLSPRPVWRSAYSSSPKYLRGQIAFERSEEKKERTAKSIFRSRRISIPTDRMGGQT